MHDHVNVQYARRVILHVAMHIIYTRTSVKSNMVCSKSISREVVKKPFPLKADL